MHFSFVSIPAAGHVNPTLAVVSELVRRGHRVTYFTAPGYAPRIKDAGAAFRASGEDWMAWLPVPGSGQPPRGPQLLPMMQRVFEDLRESFPALVGQLREDPPDAVCFDAMTLSGSMAAEKIGVPAIALMPTYATNEHFSFRALLPGAPPPEMKEAWTTAARLLAEFAAGQGVKTPRIFDGPPAPFNIVFIPREFQPMGETFDERFRFVGPSVDRRESDPAWTHEGPRPLLFISLGTTPLEPPPGLLPAVPGRLRPQPMGRRHGHRRTDGPQLARAGSCQCPGPAVLSATPGAPPGRCFPHPCRHELDHGSPLFRSPAGGRPAAARAGGHGPPAGGAWPGPPAGGRGCDCAGPFARCFRGQRR